MTKRYGEHGDPLWMRNTPAAPREAAPAAEPGKFTGEWQPPSTDSHRVPLIIGAVILMAVIGIFIGVRAASGRNEAISVASADAAPVAVPAVDATAALVAADAATPAPADTPADDQLATDPSPPKEPTPDPPEDKGKGKGKGKAANNGNDKPPRDKQPSANKGGTVTLTVLVVPPSAKVVVGNQTVRGSITVPRSKDSLPIKVTAEGYKAKTLNVVPDRNRELVLQLMPDAQPTEPKPTEPKPTEPQGDPPPDPGE